MFLVIDFEATCWDQKENRPRSDMEIIEIGAVLLRDEFMGPKYVHLNDDVPSFSTFVHPTKHPKLSKFCKDLTSITQEDVDSANYFPEALGSFLLDVKSYLGAEPINNIKWGSWGMYDHNQLLSDCKVHKVRYPFGKHWNIKTAYSKSRGVQKGFGLAKALRQLDLEFEGTHHRGVDDAVMISKIVRRSLGDSYRRFRDGNNSY